MNARVPESSPGWLPPTTGSRAPDTSVVKLRWTASGQKAVFRGSTAAPETTRERSAKRRGDGHASLVGSGHASNPFVRSAPLPIQVSGAGTRRHASMRSTAQRAGRPITRRQPQAGRRGVMRLPGSLSPKVIAISADAIARRTNDCQIANARYRRAWQGGVKKAARLTTGGR